MILPPRDGNRPETVAPGWPRPRAPYEGRRADDGDDYAREPGMLPVPWVLLWKQDGVNVWWTEFHDEAARAHHERLCQVCGERMGGAVLLGVSSPPHQGRAALTSGPGCHPRCMALTIKHCPHFREIEDGDPVAFRYDGKGRGYSPPGARSWYGYEPYSMENQIVRGAVPLTAVEVRALARELPLG